MVRRVLILLSGVTLLAGAARGVDVGATLVADGFDYPVGKPNGVGYYCARGYRPNGHLGEDWNGRIGGDSDLGAPVYTIANGLVVFARKFEHGWGNVVIVRHVFEERGEQRIVDSLYGHLDRILVRYGQQLRRGQVVGTIGTGDGRYEAHLHFEIRKDIRVGLARHRFPQDDRVYYSPADFIKARRRLRPVVTVAAVRMNTFADYAGEATLPAQVATAFRVPLNSSKASAAR